MNLKGAEIRNFEGIICAQKKGNDTYHRHSIVIPHYQRPYKWTSDHVEQLILDWSQNKQQYFAGSIVTVHNEDTRQSDLIDGQQRFTTIFLINYIRFLLLRVMVRETNTQKGLERRHDNVLHALMNSQKYLATEDQKLKDYQNYIADFIPDNEVDENTLLNRFLSYANFPQESQETDGEIYFKEHYQLMKDMFQNQDLILKYDRQYFNVVLKDTLSRVSITMHSQQNPKLHFFPYSAEENDVQENAKNYIDAIKAIFSTFENIAKSQLATPLTSFAVAEKLNLEMTNFLENIQLCVIETGNTEDAYTLFEVLNDRSLALDNLDLLKNQFYKTYVLTNDINEIEKDKNIAHLDDQWYEDIFKKSRPEGAKKLISFLGVTYLTGDKSLSIKQSDKFLRDAIKKYLAGYTKQRPYTFEKIQRDFNIFQSCSLILDNAKVKYRGEKAEAYKATYLNKSILNSTIHLLKALNQESVLAGLFAFLLNYIRYRENITDFNPIKIEKLTNSYLTSDTPHEIHNQCFDLWRISMKAKDFKPVLNFSSSLLTNNSLASLDLFRKEISESLNQELNEQFLNWLRTWTFNQTNTFKLRILFARSFQLREDENGNLIESDFYKTIKENKIENLDVDHMEPREKNKYAKDLYLEDLDRDSIVNQLGNMMILTSKENRSKSNSPMESVFVSLKKIGLDDHFISQKTASIFEQSDSFKINKNSNIKVPTPIFFNKRKEMMVDTFSKVVNVPFQKNNYL